MYHDSYINNFKYSQPNSANATALDHLELIIRLATGIHQAVGHFFDENIFAL
jgi:hypothetical protein